MQWNKQGLIYVPDGSSSWAKSHAMIPTPDLMGEYIRIYFGSRDSFGIGRIGYIDVLAENPRQIVNLSVEPVLDIGLPGSFDDSGVVPTCILTPGHGIKYLYYVGFEICTKIRYRLLTGVAISKNNGETFYKVQHTPILERSHKELYFRCGPFVMLDKGIFKLWYIAGNKWICINKKNLPVYTVHYLESDDGLLWEKEGRECLSVSNNEHGFGRPFVVKQNNIFKMFYSIRKKNKGYRLGYAESNNGIDWIRKDEDMGLDVSDSGWDSETICYSSVIQYREKLYLFYNGNDFGRSGIGYAVLGND